MDDAFWRVQVIGTTSSTQDIIKDFAAAGEPEGLVIQALQQTGGRGRHGNGWVSPLGNLYMSVLLRPGCRADRAGQMAFTCAVALSDAIGDVIADGHARTLKWPNDVMIDGRKISGILLETSLDSAGRVAYLAVGTGVNIFAAPGGSVGLDSIKRERIAINGFRDLYLDCLYTRYREWKDKGFAPIREAWLKQAHGLGETMKIRLPEVSYQGVFRGVDDSGALVADVDGQTRVFTAGEVHFGVN